MSDWTPGIPDRSQSPVWLLVENDSGKRRALLAYWDDEIEFDDGRRVGAGWSETRDFALMDWWDYVDERSVIGWKAAQIPAEVAA